MRTYKLVLCVIASVAFSAYVAAQPLNQTARRVQSANALPAACFSSTNVKDLIWQNGVGLNVCTGSGVWTGLATVAGTVPSARTISTTAPLGGGGDLSADRTLTCTLCLTSAANSIALGNIAQIATNTILGNSTNATANISALSIGSCSTSGSALVWTTNTGFGCNTSIAANTVTTNANLTGVITSVGNATSIGSQTGTGTKFVMDTSPTIVTPTIASFTNATHNHQNAAGGGALTDAAITFTAPALGAPTATTIQTSGNIGLGLTKSATAGQWLTAGSAANQADLVVVQNTDAVDTASKAALQALADTANLLVQGHGTGRTVSRLGHAIGGYTELQSVAGNGLMIDTLTAVPLEIGTNATLAIRIDSAQNTTFSGQIIPSQTIGIVGTTTNNNANAGAFGEYQTGTVAANTTSLSTGTTANVGTNTNITLTAGDWDCSGVVNFTFGAATSITNLAGGISTTTATLPAQDSYFDYETSAIVPTGTAVATWVVPTVRLSLSGSTSVFLVSQATFTVSTIKVGGTIRCRRMR